MEHTAHIWLINYFIQVEIIGNCLLTLEVIIDKESKGGNFTLLEIELTPHALTANLPSLHCH